MNYLGDITKNSSLLKYEIAISQVDIKNELLKKILSHVLNFEKF